MESLQVPFHFASTFLVTVAAAAGVWVSLARPAFAPQGRATRLGFGAGWALLGLGEALHGSLLAVSELNQVGLAARSGAYAFLVLSMLGSRRRPAGRALQVAPVAGSGAAFMPIFLAAASAFFALRSSLAESRRLAFAFAALAFSELMFGAGGTVPGGPFYIAHGARLAAAAFIAAWLWQALRTSIQVRFIALILGLLVIVVVVLSSVMTQVFTTNVREDAIGRTALEGQLQGRALRGRERDARQDARSLAQNPSVRENMAAGDSSTLSALARTTQQPGGLLDSYDFVAFMNARGKILGISAVGSRGERLLDEVQAASIAGAAVVRSALRSVEASSIDRVGASQLGVIGAFPVIAPRGTESPGSPPRLAGVVALGNLIDRAYLGTLPGAGDAEEGREFSVVDADSVLISTFLDSQGLVPDPALLRVRVFQNGGVLNLGGRVGGFEYFHSFVPLKRTDGEVMGALVVSQRSEVLQATQQDVGRTLFLVALAAAALALALSLLSGSRITGPIRRLRAAAERVRAGELDLAVEKSGEDEVGALEDAFGEMTASISKLTGELRETAAQEASLRSQLETILQSMGDGVIAVDAGGRVMVINREAERILGIKPARAAGEKIERILKMKQADGKRPLHLPLYEAKRGAVRGVVNGPKPLPLAVTSAPIESDQGEIVGAVGVIRDLTREVEVDRMKSEFLSNISHELRTPLTPIKGYAGMLRRSKLGGRKVTTFAASIEEAANRLERIVEMLVTVSAMEAGRLNPDRKPVKLERLTAEAVKRWQRAAPKHRFERRGFRGLPEINVDGKLIGAAIDELIDNAVKFNPGGCKIAIRAEGGKEVRLSVSDAGVGVPEEIRKSIMTDFVQADASETRRYGGLGLGLSYVRRIAEAHEGGLSYESPKSGGATFTIALPRNTPRRR